MPLGGLLPYDDPRQVPGAGGGVFGGLGIDPALAMALAQNPQLGSLLDQTGVRAPQAQFTPELIAQALGQGQKQLGEMLPARVGEPLPQSLQLMSQAAGGGGEQFQGNPFAAAAQNAVQSGAQVGPGGANPFAPAAAALLASQAPGVGAAPAAAPTTGWDATVTPAAAAGGGNPQAAALANVAKQIAAPAKTEYPRLIPQNAPQQAKVPDRMILDILMAGMGRGLPGGGR